MNWKSALLTQDSSIFDAIKNLEKTAVQIVLVINSKKNFVGTLTDGDIRVNILRGIKLNTSIQKIMNKNPITVKKKISEEDALEIMKKKSINHLPIIKK